MWSCEVSRLLLNAWILVFAITLILSAIFFPLGYGVPERDMQVAAWVTLAAGLTLLVWIPCYYVAFRDMIQQHDACYMAQQIEERLLPWFGEESARVAALADWTRRNPAHKYQRHVARFVAYLWAYGPTYEGDVKVAKFMLRVFEDAKEHRDKISKYMDGLSELLDLPNSKSLLEV